MLFVWLVYDQRTFFTIARVFFTRLDPVLDMHQPVPTGRL